MTCEFCHAHPATDTHHVARGSSRQASDPYPELQLSLCRDCHETIEDQKDQRAIGLALCVLAGRASLARIMDLFWKVTKRTYPDEHKVRQWVCRLEQR